VGAQKQQIANKMETYYGLKLSGTLEQCKGCGMAKAKQKDMHKQTEMGGTNF
jgi:hypothetical protein